MTTFLLIIRMAACVVAAVRHGEPTPGIPDPEPWR